ncbi:GNAT family N-acetyltransferase [Streptomyces phyllanthi]|uniref:GNAT family N-acetyltransferase n=1 Tax=Streptomyces phyllanthi TaxID=1803180 RepID=UPI002AD2C3C5|nr:GNAT family N-acetyltransferase [Streptomyces phyllanthi]
MELRSVTEEDLEALARLDEEAFAEDAYPYFVLRQLFDVWADNLLVLDDGEELRGYVLVATAPQRQRSCILGLGVTRDQRGRGHGRRLMLEILDRLKDDDVREVWLTVHPDNGPAIDLYQSLGFIGEPEIRKDYFGKGQHRLVMTLSL